MQRQAKWQASGCRPLCGVGVHGGENGVQATRALLDWVAAQGEQPIAHASAQGEVFGARYETFLIDDRTEPDRHRWMIELAIQLRS